MSLVNDMLRDLSKRSPVSNKAARVHGTFNSRAHDKRPQTRHGLILAGVVAAGLLAGYFYVESMKVSAVQPFVIAPRMPESSLQGVVPAPVPVAEATSAAPLDAADMPAVELVAELREIATHPDGFTLLLEFSEPTRFDVLRRTAHGITLHVDGVDRYNRASVSLPGMGLQLVNDGLEVSFSLDRPTDFLVREDSETPGFDILITASHRVAQTLTETALPAPGPDNFEMPMVVPPVASAELPASASSQLQQSQQATVLPQVEPAPRAGPNAAVRVTRELALEDRDRNNSQSALMLVQGGRMAEALQQLLVFIEQNPAAHQSRETLAKLLFAQQAYAQAGTVIDQGLEQVPNFAPFKKIKARLLMQNGDAPQALALLRNVPPAVATDAEYHELLATLYQQGNYHQQALTSYQDLLRTDRTQGRWWTGLGISLEAQGQEADALSSYQTALQSSNLDANLRRFVQNRISNLGSAQ
jgi:predicted Zn-dependent protease